MKLVYIAGPYRGKEEGDVAMNIDRASDMAKSVCRIGAEHGWFPVTPHLNTAHFENTFPLYPDTYWLLGTQELLMKCQAVLLTEPEAATFSQGTRNEVAVAEAMGIPVYRLLSDFISACEEGVK